MTITQAKLQVADRIIMISEKQMAMMNQALASAPVMTESWEGDTRVLKPTGKTMQLEFVAHIATKLS